MERKVDVQIYVIRGENGYRGEKGRHGGCAGVERRLPLIFSLLATPLYRYFYLPKFPSSHFSSFFFLSCCSCFYLSLPSPTTPAFSPSSSSFCYYVDYLPIHASQCPGVFRFLLLPPCCIITTTNNVIILKMTLSIFLNLWQGV